MPQLHMEYIYMEYVRVYIYMEYIYMEYIWKFRDIYEIFYEPQPDGGKKRLDQDPQILGSVEVMG